MTKVIIATLGAEVLAMNVTILIGRLAQDPELRYTPEGYAVASFTVATDRPFVDKDGQREADFVNCIAWRTLAKQVGQYARKGRLVAVQGRLQLRSYDAKDGTRRRAAEVIASQVRFLDSTNSRHQQERTAQALESVSDQTDQRTVST
jgi:single-strand DNA-binding protein